MERGEIWIVEFPSLGGHEQAGTRPAIILAEAAGIAVIIPVTSNSAALRFNYTLDINPTNRNGLSSKSVAIIFQLRATDKRRLLKKIGNLEESYIKRINEMIRELLKV